jgi:hypothetical protein
VSKYFSNFYLPHYFVPFVLLYGQETQMSADIKTFVTHVLQQGFCLDAITVYSPWYSL